MKVNGKVKYCPECKNNFTLERSPFSFLLGIALPLGITAVALIQARLNWITLGILFVFLALFRRYKRCSGCGLPEKQMQKAQINIKTTVE